MALNQPLLHLLRAPRVEKVYMDLPANVPKMAAQCHSYSQGPKGFPYY